VAVGVGANLAVQLAGGRYAANRMLGTPAGDYLNLGAVIRLHVARSSLPKPSGVSAPATGMTRLSIRAEDAATVEVAGEFNHWEFVSTRRASNGVWFADLRIPAGQYRYAFRINGKEWRIPAGATAAEDEFGGKSAWLTVDPTAGRSGRSETPTEERK
jgi:1,4-alpha-glucan branching enzyme